MAIGDIVLPSGGGGVAALANNTVVVNSGFAADAAPYFTTWAAADTYVQTQTPAINDVWVIEIGGTNSENIIVKPYTRIKGTQWGTILTGNLTSSGAFGADTFERVIENVTVDNVTVGTAGRGIVAINCNISGGTLTASSIFVCFNSLVTGGTFTGAVALQFNYSSIQGGTYDDALDAFQCNFISTGSQTVAGGSFKFCQLNSSGTTTYSGGNDYDLINSTWTSDITVGAGKTMKFYNLTYEASPTITADTGTIDEQNIAGTRTIA